MTDATETERNEQASRRSAENFAELERLLRKYGDATVGEVIVREAESRDP
jgi:hypothetical protein